MNFPILQIQFLPHRKHSALHKKDKQVKGVYGNNHCLLYNSDSFNMTSVQSVKFYMLNQVAYTLITVVYGDRGSTVIKVLCHKSEGRWFDPS